MAAKARVRIPIIVLGPDGRPLQGASVVVRDQDNNDATIYSARTGGSPIANPQITDAKGRIAGYVERGVYTSLASHVSMPQPDTAEWEATPGGDGTIDVGWFGAHGIGRDALADDLKPSAGAEPGDEALRAIGDGPGEVVAGNDPRLSNPRTPTAHAASHAGGGDKLYASGSVSFTADGTGAWTSGTINHGLGVTPSNIVITMVGAGMNRTPAIVARNSTSFQVHFSGGADGGAYSFLWTALR